MSGHSKMERRRLACGLTVDVAVTEAEWQQGLSGITWMSRYFDSVDGMLFEFDESKCWAVTTHETLIPLFGYWLDELGTVVAKIRMEQESSVMFVPLKQARYLVEVITPLHWAIGDVIDLEAVHESVGHPNTHSGEAE